MNIDREESLFLTVSEDHRRREYPEFVRIMSAPYSRAGGAIAVYEGVILGGADRLFDLDELNIWLRRHRYAAFNMHILLSISHLCLECAVRCRLSDERPGIPVLAERAAAELLSFDPLRYRASSRDWLKIYWLARQFPATLNDESREIIARLGDFKTGALDLFESLVWESQFCPDAKSLVLQAVKLYKLIITRYFAPDHDRDPVPEHEIFEDGEFAGEHLEPEREQEKEPESLERELKFVTFSNLSDGAFELSADALASIPAYLEKNFGPSFKTEREMQEIERTACTGIHEERRLLFTDGLPESVYSETGDRARSAIRCREANRKMLAEHADSVRVGIRSIEQAFQNVLNLKSDPETYLSADGTLINSRLWQVGRCENPQLFYKVFQQEQPSVAVELLIDASGSQSVRESMVALQSYIFSAALSGLHIPHRVMSYCTYGDHTVLRRFRDYDDGAEADIRILDYHASSNNRDGLALAAAGADLLRRREEHKIVIVFSDGLPNDMVAGRQRPGMPKKYVGDTAVKDTCFQVRKLIRQGAHVIGVFLGEDDELENERMIYGASFLRIRRAEDFGGTAGRRLRDTLMQL